MVNLETKLTGDITEGLDRFAKKVQNQIALSGVAAMAGVIYDEVKLNTSGARKTGPGSPPGTLTGNLDASIYRVYAKDKSGDQGQVYRVSWRHTGSAKGGGNHGHLLEFGTIRAPAYPFLRPALSKINDAIRAGQDRMRARLSDAG